MKLLLNGISLSHVKEIFLHQGPWVDLVADTEQHAKEIVKAIDNKTSYTWSFDCQISVRYEDLTIQEEPVYIDINREADEWANSLAEEEAEEEGYLDWLVS